MREWFYKVSKRSSFHIILCYNLGDIEFILGRKDIMKKNGRRVVLFCLFFICSIVITGCSKKVSQSDIIIDKILWTEEGVFKDYEKMGLLIKNNSDTATDIEINAECYDKKGNYLDKRSTSIYALAPGNEYFMNISLDSGIADISYSYGCKKTRYKAITSSDMSVSFKSEKGIGTLTVKNNSDKDAEVCNCAILFYNEFGEIIGDSRVSMNRGDVPKGKTVSEEVDYPIAYESVQIYINAYSK